MQTIASLQLSFDVRDNQTKLCVRKQNPPLRVVRAFPIDPGQAVQRYTSQCANGQTFNGNENAASDPAEEGVKPVLVHLHNVSGGLLGGDQLRLEAHIGTGSQVQLTSTGSTRVYRARHGYPTTTQTTRFSVESGGLLEYLPDSLIPYVRSQYRQMTRIELAAGSGLFYWEIVSPGREAKGECFDYDLLQIELEIVADGQPIVIERSRIEPNSRQSKATEAEGAGLERLARMGPYRYFASFYICRVGIEKEKWLELERQLDVKARSLSEQGRIVWGVSTLAAHGLIIRTVSTTCQAIQQALPQFWCLAKECLYNQKAIMPRKVY